MSAALLWLPLTLAAYLAATWLYRRSGAHPLLVPVLTAVLLVVAALAFSRTPWPVYADATSGLTWLLGPATVALALPLYEQAGRLRAIGLPVAVALLAGSLTAIVSALAIGWALGASPPVLLSLAPKSATMPMAIPVAERIGAVPALAALAVALTGIAGTMLARPLLNLLRIRDAAARGFAVGLTAHAIGMARELQDHPVAGAYAALGMGLNGMATAVLVPVAVGGLRSLGLL
ncbi:LrgB family protein [Ramlibacter tataouinensis]|uniref:LrgB family protein n=1 Tax=Ramlibacter tataouinensis TaxID=94132 RepID=UPI0022F39D8F|nr:LrgB family protein [Ramlibacter tataouinensis]WBY02658.1 LrgB family protein [Ramlibacter tataouinensis]